VDTLMNCACVVVCVFVWCGVQADSSSNDLSS
jgi:hypothetical protein